MKNYIFVIENYSKVGVYYNRVFYTYNIQYSQLY